MPKSNSNSESDNEIVPSRDTLSDWQIMQMAIALTESHFNPNAVGKDSDKGVLQLTPIYVREVNRLTGMKYTEEDCFSIDLSLKIFSLMQEAKNPEKDLDRAIYYHNKSPYYHKAVKENMEQIRKAEEMRRRIINFRE